MAQVNEQVIRDIAIVASLMLLLEEIGVNVSEHMADEEAEKIGVFVDTLPKNPEGFAEVTVRMFRESVERLLAEANKAEVTQNDEV